MPNIVKNELIVIVHNIRSTFNVGAILRTADGLGVSKVYFTGYSPYPRQKNDKRLPHLSSKITDQIHKTALGAEESVPHEYNDDILNTIHHLKAAGFTIVGLEQNPESILLPNLKPPAKCALLLGEEVNGLNQELINECDILTEIPMKGKKESFNVSVAAAIALYELSKLQS